MFRPQIQKTWVVLLVAIFSIMMVYFALANITYYETVGFQDKIEAAKIMKEALSVLKKEVKKQYPDVPILEDIDPNLTGLIFNRPKSPMTTYSGDLKSKQTVLKPNFSALIVDLFLQAKLSKGDTFAIWFDSIRNNSGEIIELISNGNSCEDIAGFHESIQKAMKKQALQKFCVWTK